MTPATPTRETSRRTLVRVALRVSSSDHHLRLMGRRPLVAIVAGLLLAGSVVTAIARAPGEGAKGGSAEIVSAGPPAATTATLVSPRRLDVPPFAVKAAERPATPKTQQAPPPAPPSLRESGPATTGAATIPPAKTAPSLDVIDVD